MATEDRAPTFDDIAHAAGVSPSTVSRALSNPERVSARTRERIEAIAQEMGYLRRPYRRGRGPTLRRTVATVVAELSNPFAAAFLEGAQRQLNAAGYAQLLIDSDGSPELELSMVQRIRDRVDGIILVSTGISIDQLEILGTQLPIVALNRQLHSCSTIIIDSPSSYRRALEHLVSLGHRRVIYVAGPAHALMDGLRWRALVSVAEERGVELSRTAPFPPVVKSGAAAADAVLNSDATACIAFNDFLAIGMLRRFQERGVRVPEDISVVGCDDIFGADFCNPPLTTITSPLARAGQSAVTLLLEEIEKGSAAAVRRIVLPTYMTIRESTGSART